ncbi:MAG: LPS-assembly protein LptD [Candidatus Aminicenantaceae bacterium]
MSRNKTVIFIVFIFLFVGNAVFGQEETSFSGRLKIIANYEEKINNRIFARGNVELHYNNIKLFADKVELNTETKDVFAEGNVVIQLPEEVVSAQSVFFNLDSSKGELVKVFGMVKPTVFYEADSMERREENVYSFEKAKLTSCTQPVPRWKFSCTKANFKKDNYMEMWNSVFSIRKIPVFYFPYIRYPLKERASGFLMPQLGYSEPKGIFYSQSFYWAIRKNMDTTFNFNYYSAKGKGVGLEYRYLFSAGTGGNLNAYYFTFKEQPEQEKPPDAYIIRFNHNQVLPFNFSLVADIDYQSSFDFLREFDNNFMRAVVSNRRSQVYLSRAWSYFNFNMRVSRFETYFTEMDNSIIKHNLPQIGFSSSKIKIFSPLYFSFSSSFSRWEYGWESDYKEGIQTSSQSLGFRPMLTLPFTTIPWLTANFSLAANFNYHFQSTAPDTGEIVDEPLLAHNYGFEVELIGPVLYKIFFDAKNTAKLKHIIEPSFLYHYDTPVPSSDRIITAWFFSRDHFIRYGLTNRFLIKQDKMPREVLTLGVAQTFYLDPEEGPLQIYRVNGEIPRFSDISGYLRFYPTSKYSVDFSAGYNPYYKTFSSLRLGANLGSAADSLFIRVNWYKSINPYAEDVLWDRHQINVFAGIKIPKLSVEFQVENDFNIQEMEMLYSAFALVYSYQCLDFRADLRIFYFREKPETQFRITIGLGNIGKTTDFLGGMGF